MSLRSVNGAQLDAGQGDGAPPLDSASEMRHAGGCELVKEPRTSVEAADDNGGLKGLSLARPTALSVPGEEAAK